MKKFFNKSFFLNDSFWRYLLVLVDKITGNTKQQDTVEDLEGGDTEERKHSEWESSSPMNLHGVAQHSKHHYP